VVLPNEHSQPNFARENLDIVLFSAKPEDEITLSVYNKKDEFFKKRPNTAPLGG
jgi:hypothetical protein